MTVLAIPAGPVITSVLVVLVALVAFWLWAVIDLLSWPAPTWDAAGVSKARWAVRVLLIGTVGAVLYLRGPRPHLKAAYAVARSKR